MEALGSSVSIHLMEFQKSSMTTINHSSSYNRTFERKVVEEGPKVGGGVQLQNFPGLSSFQPSSSFILGPHNYHFGSSTSGSYHATDDSLSVSLDVSAYAPEDLKVSVVGRYIVVEAKHPEKADELGLIARSFTRKFLMPKNSDPEAVASNLSSDGLLTITVTPPKPKEVSPNRTIPIKIVNGAPEQKQNGS
uniref:SHSP domain-containing protein n=1 Tax=Panagrellus redivivus TaxID=6233 RepID=A0A7E4V186_PANRE